MKHSIGGYEMSDEFNIEAALTKLDGKIDSVKQSIDSTKEEMGSLRTRVHDLSNELMKLIGINIPGTMEMLREGQKNLERRTEILEHDMTARKSALNTIKLVYGVGGTTIGGLAVALILKLVGGI